jgi:hypothetical protein
MLKKWFDWTPSDVAAWEKIRARGLWHFVRWYGLGLFGGGLSILLGGVTFYRWMQSPVSLAGLGLELALVASLCLLGGALNSLLTWWLEESIYRKIVAGRAKE